MNKYYESQEIAELYRKYRPRFPSQVADSVLKYYNSQQQQTNDFESKLDLMVDVGCGSGQSSEIFQPYFKKIIGCDVSQEQIKQAKIQNVYENIEYVEGSSDNIPVFDKSVDLVVAGAAVHLFDLPKFFQEVKRILKPTGCLTIFSYLSPKINLLQSNNHELSSKATDLLAAALYDKVANHLKPNYMIFMNRYADIYNSMPFPNKQRDDSLHMTYTYSINDLCGFIRSLDSYHTYMQSKHEWFRINNVEITEELISSIDPSEKFVQQLQSVWEITKSISRDQKLFTADYELFVLLAKP